MTTIERHVEELRGSIADIDERIGTIMAEARERCEPLRAERAQLRNAVKRLTGEAPRRRRRDLDPVDIAGSGLVREVEAYLVKHGKAFQADITRDLDKNSGSITWALRALAAEGKIRATGVKRGNSPEFEYLPAARRSRRQKAAA